MVRWIAVSAALGLIVPALAYGLFLVTGHAFGLLELLVWPAAILLLANERATTGWEVAANFAVAIGLNVLLYTLLGLALFGVRSVWSVLRPGQGANAKDDR